MTTAVQPVPTIFTQPRCAGEFGYYGDSATLQYVRARWLAVGTGRWLSEDPLRFDAGDYNLYRYVGNEPVARQDASGLGVCKCGCGRKNCYCHDPYCNDCQRAGHLPAANECNNSKWDRCIDIALAKFCKNCSQHPKPTRHQIKCRIFAETNCGELNRPTYGGRDWNYGLLQVGRSVWSTNCRELGTWKQIMQNDCLNIACAVKALCSQFKCNQCRYGTSCAHFGPLNCCRHCWELS